MSKTRMIEMGMAFVRPEQWTTTFVEIPADTPDDQVEAVGRKVLRTELEVTKVEIAGAWLHNSMEDGG